MWSGIGLLFHPHHLLNNPREKTGQSSWLWEVCCQKLWMYVFDINVFIAKTQFIIIRNVKKIFCPWFENIFRQKCQTTSFVLSILYVHVHLTRGQELFLIHILIIYIYNITFLRCGNDMFLIPHNNHDQLIYKSKRSFSTVSLFLFI